jgi:hypothetical protein
MAASPVAAPTVAAPNDATPVADAALNDATPVADAFEAAFPVAAASVTDTTVAAAPTHCKDAALLTPLSSRVCNLELAQTSYPS